MRVLVVEDEAELAGALRRGLRARGMLVDVALDGSVALDKLSQGPYDVVVLDRDLPVVHGDEVCRRLAENAERPRILMLTAAASIGSRVKGLELGADDYLGKPFALAELVARIEALARRPALTRRRILTAADVAMDCDRREVRRQGHLFTLTTKEFDLLRALLEADGTVVSSEALLARVWDENADPFTATVRVTMANLRKKLGSPPLIDTVVGAGYVIRRPDDEA